MYLGHLVPFLTSCAHATMVRRKVAPALDGYALAHFVNVEALVEYCSRLNTTTERRTPPHPLRLVLEGEGEGEGSEIQGFADHKWPKNRLPFTKFDFPPEESFARPGGGEEGGM